METIELFDLFLAVGFILFTVLWFDERHKRIELESRLKRHRTNVLLQNATSKSELIERGG